MKVFLVDDHTLFLRSLINLLNLYQDFKVVGYALTAHEALTKIAPSKPDLILIDILLPDMSGFDLVVALKRIVPEARLVFLTASEKDTDLERASELGASGYLLKTIEPDDFIRYLREISQGACRISPEVAGRLFAKFPERTIAENEAPGSPSASFLSRRELEVLQLLRDGLTNKEIAAALFISENTVKNHLKSIYAKLGATTRAHAVAKAAELHLLPRREPSPIYESH